MSRMEFCRRLNPKKRAQDRRSQDRLDLTVEELFTQVGEIPFYRAALVLCSSNAARHFPVHVVTIAKKASWFH